MTGGEGCVGLGRIAERRFGVLRAVSQFCEANDQVLELARRLTAAVPAPPVTVTVLKDGVVRTKIRSQFPTWMKLLVPLIFDPFLAQTPLQIAASARQLLLERKFEGVSGARFRHNKKFKKLKVAPHASDLSSVQRLWGLSELLASQARAASMPGESKS